MSSLAFLLLCIQAKNFTPAPAEQRGCLLSEILSVPEKQSVSAAVFRRSFQDHSAFSQAACGSEASHPQAPALRIPSDQFRRHAFAKLKLLLQLTSALLILPIFDIIAHIALIIQITIAFYISNGLLHQLRLKLRLQKLLPKLGLRPVHPLQKVQRLNLRFLQPGLRLLPVLLLLLSALLSLVIHNAP